MFLTFFGGRGAWRDGGRDHIYIICLCVYYIYTLYIDTLMMHPSKEKSTALGCIPHILSYIVLFEPRDMFESHF
jgi:hypothetical protein